MPEFKDYTGKHINHFNVFSFNSFNKHGESTWNVKCDCGRSDLEIRTLSSIKRSKFGCRICMNEYKLEE